MTLNVKLNFQAKTQLLLNDHRWTDIKDGANSCAHVTSFSSRYLQLRRLRSQLALYCIAYLSRNWSCIVSFIY